MKRQYWLTNEKGEAYYLNNEIDVIMYKVKGMGVETGISFFELGNGFFLPVESDKRPQTPITGTVMFYGEQPEDEYVRFCNFAGSAKELYFNYAPSVRRYQRRVKLNFLTRDGLTRYPVLKVPVSFLPLTPWYTTDVETYTLGLLSDGFRAMDEAYIDSFDEAPLDESEFPLETDGGEGLESETDEMEEVTNAESRVWDETTSEGSCLWQRLTETDVMEAGIIINPKGELESTFQLEYDGVASSPTIYIIGVNSQIEYGRLALNTSINAGERLIYSTNKLDSYIKKVSGGSEIDLLNYADLSYEIFPRLPTTEPCRIGITSNGQIDGTLTVNVQRYVLGV